MKLTRKRNEIEKYSHVATLEEIKENDYNLNISRYVETFENEEEVDIAEISKKLKELNKRESALLEKIAEFCDELKISRPF